MQDKDIVYSYLMAPIKSQLDALAKDMLPRGFQGVTYDDLVDVAMNKVWEKIQPPYLYIMAKNSMRDYLKHEKAETFYRELMADPEATCAEDLINELTGGDYDEFIAAATIIRGQRRCNSKTLLGYLNHMNPAVAKLAKLRVDDLKEEQNG